MWIDIVSLKRIIRITKTLIRDTFNTSIWRVGVIDKPIQEIRSSDLADAKWIAPPSGVTCMADPFGYSENGRDFIFCEKFEPIEKTGNIMTAEYNEENILRLADPFNDKAHKSYPYIFEDNGDHFLLHESSSSPNIDLYKLSGNLPVKEATIVNGFRAVDPSIIFYNNLWWLFCTNADSLECEYLYIFYSEKINGEWNSHKGNPVKKDISSTRPAGTPFIDNGVLYRPGQDCSKEYGKQITVNKVIKLDEHDFLEEPSYIIDSTHCERYRDGIHTISKFGNRTLVDAKVRIPRYKLRIEAL